MKLSEAIRLGAMLKRQAFGWAMDRDGRTCALGAASEAVGLPLGVQVEPPMIRFNRAFPIAKTKVNRCPTCNLSLNRRDQNHTATLSGHSRMSFFFFLIVWGIALIVWVAGA